MWDRAVFLDRDNTIIENDGYLGDPAQVKLLPGAGTALTAMRALGYRLIVVSNQSGVARGMFDEGAVEAVNQEMSRQLQEQAGAYVDASYYCPYHPEAPLAEYRVDHDWRKPRCGMLKQAATDFGLDLSQSWMIGDQNRDIGAGAAAGCRTILLRDPDVRAATETDAVTAVSPNFVVRTLADAARILAREGRTQSATAAPEAAPTAPHAAAGPPASASYSTDAPVLASTSPASSLPAPETPAAAGVLSYPPSASGAAASGKSASEAFTERLHAHGALLPANSPLGNAPPTRLEKTLDELVIQLRNQNRHADLRPDFSYSNMGAVILQCLAVAALFMGLNAYFRAPVHFTPTSTWGDYTIAGFARQTAIIWLLTGAILQGMVIALLVRARNKH